MSLFACKIIHQGHKRIKDEYRGRKEINSCLAAGGVTEIWIKCFSADVVFFPVHPAVLKYQAKIDLLVL